MEPSGLYFDPKTGKLTTERRTDHRKTGKLTTYDLGDRQVMEMIKTGGYFGGCYSETLEASLPHSSDEFITEVNCFDEAISSTGDFYKIQSLQTLGESNDRVSVPIWIECANHLSVASSWIPHIQQAINDINFAAPGLYLYRTTVKSKAKVEIFGNSVGRCFTRGNIVENAPEHAVEISLEHHWEIKNRTSCHELLHALGFGHEHQRRDRHLSIDVPMEEVTDEWKSQYQRKNGLLGITRLDPHSIMMYPEDQLLLRNTNDPVWFTKPTNEYNEEMSELDKISLNNLYRPCKGPNYSASKVASKTGLWYCGR